MVWFHITYFSTNKYYISREDVRHPARDPRTRELLVNGFESVRVLRAAAQVELGHRDYRSQYLEVASEDALQYLASVSIEHPVLAPSVMKALTHITAGRTAIRALLIVAVLTAGIVGTSGMAAAEPMDGKGNDVYPPPHQYSLDGKGNDVLTESLDGKGNDVLTESLDGVGDDTVTYAFPIDNVTVSVDYAGRGGGSGKASL